MNTKNEEDYEGDICPKCKCCSTFWHTCDHCGGYGGRDGDELMEEDPLWYGPDDYETCDICEGNGGWPVCVGDCDENGKHTNILEINGESLRK